ncbi:tripartite tricarboxylate transporter substrate binding protein [Roseomonas sp. NAR14]|uniref:Tripartite tricarboxylate transporter substrate binding protein n=1 Tax=Roseomonas acroporae TaxID=2937791 RepID=A0A9X2BZE4_9PROT|nr:tripartite tricarboxylate transporter substrate binding protein [Roseomonas acroporae]MCK8787919.1 tripartite tricarboxylate transporter substrate binding protein [Roseomonas acroporae]
MSDSHPSPTPPAPTRRAALAMPMLLLAGRALAQTGGEAGFPNRSVRIVVPYTPGGSADIAARLLGERLSPVWGQPVVVENRAGANGIIGTEAVAKAAPDGHTLGMVSVNHAVNVALYRTPFDTLRDLATLSVIYSVPLVLVAAPDFPANTPQELAALAKRRGGIGFAGTGGAVHLAAEMFAARAGVELTHVPYRGSTAAHPDLMAGRVGIMFDPLPSVLGHVQGGKLKALAVTSAQRVAPLPDVPTMAEAGFPGFEAATWGALIAPAGLPVPVAARIAADTAAQLREPAVRERFAGFGATVVGNGPGEAQEFVAAEVAKWSEVASRAGIERQ